MSRGPDLRRNPGRGYAALMRAGRSRLGVALAAAMMVPTAAACVEVVDATPRGIWLRQPMLSFRDLDRVAAEHCARYGRTAVKAGRLGPGQYFLPIDAYDCR